ncbi:MAG: hypothetical protein WAW02_03000 [Sideroxyarcus sp.]
MATLWLDYQQNRPFQWAGTVLLVLSLLILALTVVYYRELNDRAATWEEKMESIERGYGLQAPAVSRGSAGAEGLVLEVKRANEVLRQLSLPWEELLQAVESAAGNKVSLLALEPDTEKQVVKISGEARDMAGLLDYITRLEEQSVFGPVFLQSHQVQLQNSERPVRFSLLAAWKGKP